MFRKNRTTSAYHTRRALLRLAYLPPNGKVQCPTDTRAICSDRGSFSNEWREQRMGKWGTFRENALENRKWTRMDANLGRDAVLSVLFIVSRSILFSLFARISRAHSPQGVGARRPPIAGRRAARVPQPSKPNALHV